MNNFTDQHTVGEIAASFPASVRVFQKHGIDFCCGGKLPLGQACEGHGLAPQALLEEIAGAVRTPAAAGANWEQAPLGELIDHILSRHHAYLKTELPRLGRMLAKVVEAHGHKYGDTLVNLQATFTSLREELDAHLMKEEVVLFPILRKLEAARLSGSQPEPSHCGSIDNPIRVMEFEHDGAGAALVEMRRLTGSYTVPPDACNTFRGLYYGLGELEADLHQHIHLENNILFPRAQRMERG
jgi:regulator of cell morphogenesis and NO signaling